MTASPFPGLDRERFRLALRRMVETWDAAPSHTVSQALGISRLEAARMLRQGHICSVDNFLKACQWMQMSPLSFLDK